MAVAIDTPVAGEIARSRGGFYRGANDTPYVSDPSGDLVKSGPRKGLPKRLPYGSPSGRGKQIENTYNLQKWGERRVVLGLGTDLALIADCHRLSLMEVDSDEYKTLADTIVMRAKDAAEASLAAERGTHGHALSEDNDQDRDWVQRAEAGENLGVPAEAQAALVAAWSHMLVRDGLEILAVEASCVDDTWRLAGTLDRIARTTKPLRFSRFGGETVDIPVGTVLVLDVKTGKRRLDRNGVVMYWQAYSIQIASYAQSKPYDTEAETRGEWPWPISQDHALIAHLDVLGAIDGNPSCELVYVDLALGREHGGETVVQAKAWEKRTDVFSIAQLDDAPGITDGASAEYCRKCDMGGHTCPGCGADLDHDTAVCAECRARIEAEAVAAAVPTSAAEVTPQDPAAQAPDGPPAAGAEVAPPQEEPAPPAVELTIAEQTSALPGVWAGTTPDEGRTVTDVEISSLKAAHDAVPVAGRLWFRELFTGAAHAHVAFHLKGAPTLRRFEIVRGLIALAHADSMDDETVRLLVATAMDSDAPMFPAVRLGHAVGALSADQAKTFAQLVDDLIAGRLAIAAQPGGTTRLRHLAAV